MENKKLNAFIKYLEEQGEQPKKEDIISDTDNTIFYFNSEDYLVLTEEEADELAKEEIANDLWAFNTDFILNHSTLDFNDANFEAIKLIQNELCEGANDFIKNIIEDLDFFIEEAISCDGRGHFLSYYDGKENEIDGFYIYRR